MKRAKKQRENIGLVKELVMEWRTDQVMTAGLMRRARGKTRLSLRRVARGMGISAMYLSDLERARRNWNEDLIGRWQASVKAAKAEDAARGKRE